MTCQFCGIDLTLHAGPGCKSPVMHSNEPLPYTNPGKGTVLTNNSTTGRLAAMLQQRRQWTSAELNDILGWQFSQAIYALRRKGWRITTLKLGPKSYAYRYEALL